MPVNLPPPSIPAQFARPVPQITQPAPSSALNAPGPYGASPLTAPRLPVPVSPTGPGGAAVAAVGLAQGSTAATVLPAVILAVPLAIAGGETGKPIASVATEADYIRRANQPGGLPGNSPQRPGNNTSQIPANPPNGTKKPAPPKPAPKDGVGIPVTWSVSVNVTYQSGGDSNITKQFGGYSGDVWGVSVDAQGSNLTQNDRIAWKSWTRSFAEGGGSMRITGAVPSAATPQPPADPRPPVIPTGNYLPPPSLPPNPAAPSLPPNPAAQVPSAQTANPTKQNPPLSRPTQPGQPTNPANPTQPTNPNPANPNQPTNPSQPTNPNPVNPNPAQPQIPGSPTQPTKQNPDLPAPIGPSIPSIPFPNIPGQLTPTGPSTVTTSPPVPTGPNNPPRNPCADPCIDLGLDRDKPVVIRVDKFVSCTRKLFGVPLPFDKVLVTVPNLLSPALELMLNNQAQILKQISCNACDEPIAAIPDWWQLRLGANRSQLLVLYARKFADGAWDKAKYVVSIPHWDKPRNTTVMEDFPIYDKGDFQGTRVFADNSKLIVNCSTAIEALRVLDKISLSIAPEIVRESDTSVADRRGQPLRKIKVYPRMARYFASGQKNLEPTWTIDFRK